MPKNKYSPELKIQIAREYESSKCSISSLANHYGIDHGTIEQWIKQYEAKGATTFMRAGGNNVYSEDLKERAVKDYLEGKGSLRDITARYGIRDKISLRKWIKMYNSGEGFRRKMSGGSRMKETRSTTVEERIQIAKDCIANGGNYGETALKYNVSYQQVYTWVQKYKELGEAGLEDRRGKRTAAQTPRTELEELRIKIAQLEHEKYMLQMERDVLKKLDEIERRDAFRK